MKAMTVLILAFSVFSCAVESPSPMQKDVQHYNIVRTSSIMRIKFSFTDIAIKTAEKEGKTLNAAVQGISPYFYTTLAIAAKQTPAFEAYIIDGLYTISRNSIDVAAIVVAGDYIDLAAPEKRHKNTIAQFMKKLAKNKKILISKTAIRGIKISM